LKRYRDRPEALKLMPKFGDGRGKDSKKESIGLVAHEVQNEFPFLVEGEKDGDKTQTVNYMALVGLLIKEVQELKKDLTLVKNELKSVKK
jgi:hypothetical protein